MSLSFFLRWHLIMNDVRYYIYNLPTYLPALSTVPCLGLKLFLSKSASSCSFLTMSSGHM